MEKGVKKPRFTKPEKSWILYDWANSVYATNIMAAIFPIYYASVSGDAGNKWWGVGVSISSLICAVLAPTLGAMGDFRGYKKKFLAAFIGLGVVFTALMAFVGTWQWMLIGYVISRIGFSGANVFYDAFITDVTTNERMDKVSTWGFAMGYLGGSTIPFVISIVLLLLTDFSVAAIKFSILITSVWWAVFSIPILMNVKQVHYVETPPKQLARNAGKNLLDTVRQCVTNKGLLIFMIAYFLYIDGVDTIISIATNYGATLGLGSTGMILALLVTQLVAVPCSILFSRLSEKFGSIRVILFAIFMYFCICFVGFFMGRIVEPYQLDYTASVRQNVAELDEPCLAGTADYNTYEMVIGDIIDGGKDLLANEDRSAAFSGLFDETLMRLNDMTSEVYSFKNDAVRQNVVRNVIALSERMQPFVTDAARQAGYGEALRTSSMLFWVLAALVGTVQGGIQALSRSYFGKLVPLERSAEYFGFYDIFGKFAAVMGPALYALCYMLTDRPSVGIISLLILFAGGAVLLILGRGELEKTERRVAEANRRAAELRAAAGGEESCNG